MYGDLEDRAYASSCQPPCHARGPTLEKWIRHPQFAIDNLPVLQDLRMRGKYGREEVRYEPGFFSVSAFVLLSHRDL